MATKKTEEGGREPILALDTFSPERPKVSIDKAAYEMHLPEEFSPRQRRELQKHARAINKASNPADATDLELDEYEAGVNAAFRMGFPDVPDAVATKILLEHKRVFADAFLQRFFETTAIEKSPEEMGRQITDLQTRLNRLRASRSTGGTSSQTSSGTTAPQAA